MNISAWKDIAELVGIGAIVASLIFVGMQLKQSQDIAIGTQYQQRAGKAIDIYTSHLQSETSLRMVGQTIQDGLLSMNISDDLKKSVSDLTPEEIGVRWYDFLSLLTLLDDNHFQYQAGFLDNESWEGLRIRLRNVVSDPLDRQFYNYMRPSYREQFREVIDDEIAGVEASSKR
ncbi:MAG: hypothetical protein ACR2Q3_00645 [Woeseiaceae bacterium]